MSRSPLCTTTCEPVYPECIYISAVKSLQTPSIAFAAQLVGQVTGHKIDASALQDSGAEGILINYRFARLHNLSRSRLARPIPVRNVDGSDNGMGPICYTTTQVLRLPSQDGKAYHQELVEFFIADIGEHDIILGTDWLAAHNPEVDWTTSQVDMTRCPPTCELLNPPVTHLRTLHAAPAPLAVTLEEVG